MIRGIAGASGEEAVGAVGGLLGDLDHRGERISKWSEGVVSLGAVGDEAHKLDGAAIHETAGGFGGFASARVDGGIRLGRDFIGAKPLFHASDGDRFAFCSERAPLWNLGFRGVDRVPQGAEISIDPDDLDVEFTYESKAGGADLTGKYPDALLERLRASTVKLAEGVDRGGVAFSGGLDSSTVALLLDERCDVTLFSVGLEGSEDLEWALKAAELLGLDLVERELSREDVYGAVDETLLTIQDADRMKVGVAIPLMLTADLMEGRVDSAFAGQGSDELLGGYSRHKESDSPEAEIRKDVDRMAERNAERDEHCFASRGLDLRCPFMTKPVVEAALAIPAEEKIVDGRGKIVLREATRGLLPEEIRLRPKKSVQYGTLVDRELDRLARRRGYKRRSGRHVQRFLNRRAKELGLPDEALVKV